MYKTSTGRLLVLTAGVLLSYLTVGLPLTVLSLFVRENLAFSNTLVGVAVGSQFVATVLTRAYAGRLADQYGAKQTTIRGMIAMSVAGVFYVLGGVTEGSPYLSYALLIVARLFIGFGESLLISGDFTWALGLIGSDKSGKIMSYNGMAIYGALAAGAPLGLLLFQHFGFISVGIVVIALPLIALVIDLPMSAIPITSGKRVSLLSVGKMVLQPGLAIAMQGCGFALIGTFIALLFASHHWPSAGLALTCFGVAFVLVRIFFAHLLDKFGGMKIAMISLAVEAVGQALILFAQTDMVALIGATVTGCGCSLMFPALGIEVVKRVPIQVRGVAVGGYAAFQDISYAVSGPVTGLVATAFGYSSVFAVGAACALLGIWIVYRFSKTPISEEN